ncbi:MAG TPA: NAD(P)H-binding protein [Candidatus Acidoferrales bacterium]|nr:NAD(P)H-binding protein [Candidatus Acidoferrales bacterium]
MSNVFIAGATGYMGSRLASLLLARGHRVLSLVRPGSEPKLPTGCAPVPGNALDRRTFSNHLVGIDTFVQLVGVAHPSPSKGAQFRAIDLVSCQESVAAAAASRIPHFVYVSVAHPAPLMKSYIEVRAQCEDLIRSAGLNATILRPWYVLGPGHYWPYLLKPGYWLARRIPALREGALRLGLVTLEQMLAALVIAVENPVRGIRAVNVPEIAQSATN